MITLSDIKENFSERLKVVQEKEVEKEATIKARNEKRWTQFSV